MPCEAGKYAPEEASKLCLNCPAGYSSSPGQILCTACLPGTYAPTPGSPTCDQCPPGTYNPDVGSAECQNCPKGTASNLSGAIACDTCAVGFYQNVEGQLTCLACASCGDSDTNTVDLCDPAIGCVNTTEGKRIMFSDVLQLEVRDYPPPPLPGMIYYDTGLGTIQVYTVEGYSRKLGN